MMKGYETRTLHVLKNGHIQSSSVLKIWTYLDTSNCSHMQMKTIAYIILIEVKFKSMHIDGSMRYERSLDFKGGHEVAHVTEAHRNM